MHASYTIVQIWESLASLCAFNENLYCAHIRRFYVLFRLFHGDGGPLEFLRFSRNEK